MSSLKRVGIVGHAQEKFNRWTAREAHWVVHHIITGNMPCIVVSGACHLEGVDIIARDEAHSHGQKLIEHPPENLQWQPRGYKTRNLKIARGSDEVHVVVVEDYPEGYTGMRFKSCYHCKSSPVPRHVKSGGCWTARRALRIGKDAYWHIITPAGVVHYHERAEK